MAEQSFEAFLKSQTYATLCEEAKNQMLTKSQIERIDLILQAGEILSYFKQLNQKTLVTEAELDIIHQHLIELMAKN